MIPYRKKKYISRPGRPVRPMQTQIRPTRIILVLVIMMILLPAGCGQGLRDDIKKNAKTLPNAIEAARKEIQTAQNQFESLKRSNQFKPVAPYAQKENWDRLFAEANQTLDRAQSLNKQGLIPLIKNNKPESSARVLTQINRINNVIQKARQQAKGPVNRFLRIKEAMDNTNDIHVKTLAIGNKIIDQITALEKGPVAKAKDNFLDSIEKINVRFAPFLKIQQDTKNRLDIINQEYAAHRSKKNTDYAALINNADALFQDFKTLEQTQPVLKRDMAQLYESYTKVLQDMKSDFHVIIKRESWDEDSDYYDPRVTTFQRQVTPPVYKSLIDNDLEIIAALSPGFGGIGFSNKIGNTWKALNINPKEHWPTKNHNAASFWVDTVKQVNFHKYLKEENGETSETDWIKVSPSFYEQNLEFLGMAILSKPYGVFEQDRLTQATPPGLAYMGNDNYGEWKEDDNGESFWSWYGKYALFSHLFFFPPSYFHYGGWNSWRHNYGYKKPYFGKTKNGNQRYGTHGSFIRQSPKYQSSMFSRTGGLKSQSASVRGAGAKLRGGGPKAKGK